MPAPGVDAGQIVATLLRHKVTFLVVGGFAIELWDVAVQPTLDVDITPQRSARNLEKLAAALNELEAKIRYGDETVALPGGFTKELLQDLTVLNLSTSAGPLDITVMPAGTEGYVELSQNVANIEYEGVIVPTAALEDVARSKEAAGRPKDVRVLPAIHAHLDRMKRIGQ